MVSSNTRRLLMITAVLSTFIIGCAGLEYSNRNGVWFWPTEYIEAERAIEVARSAGKNIDCPDEFKAAEQMVADAFKYRLIECHKEMADELAAEGKKKAEALCPKKVIPAPAPPPTPPPPPPKPKAIERISLHVHFDTDKAIIKDEDHDELQRALDFIKKYPDSSIVVEGHTDSRGSEEYNEKLSRRRAEAVKNYLIKKGGVDPAKISAVGYGETRPLKSNDTKDGRYWNRRVDVVIAPE